MFSNEMWDARAEKGENTVGKFHAFGEIDGCLSGTYSADGVVLNVATVDTLEPVRVLRILHPFGRAILKKLDYDVVATCIKP